MSKKNIKRESILRAATEVFSNNDFKTANISEIAQKAGVATGTIYQYYKNKEDLFFSILIKETNEFKSQLELHLEGISGAFNKIRKFVWYYLYFFKTNPDYARLLMLEMRVNKGFIKTETYNYLKQSVSQILNILTEGQNSGIIRKDTNIYILRHFILGTLENVVSRWLLKGETYDLLEHHLVISEILIAGLKSSNDQ